mmetsp:Transcript_2473/g.9669  ORF Transcript_2473/g.9669 Transcript_2473/m.9669 type:complete len:220 (-) Transcript_2473:2001-2660(-)
MPTPTRPICDSEACVFFAEESFVPSRSKGTYVTSHSTFMGGRDFFAAFLFAVCGNSIHRSIVACGLDANSLKPTLVSAMRASRPNPPCSAPSASWTPIVRNRSFGSSTSTYSVVLNTGSLLLFTTSVYVQRKPFVLARTRASALLSTSVPTTFSARTTRKQTKPTSRSFSTFSTYHWCVFVEPSGSVTSDSGSAMGTTSRSGHTSVVSRMFSTSVSSQS